MHSLRRTSLAVSIALTMVVTIVGLADPAPAFGHPNANAVLKHRPPRHPMHSTLLADGLQGSIGATIGPDGALYVAEGVLGQITRIDPSNGDATVFASGFPPGCMPLGGAMDVAFVGDHAICAGDGRRPGCRREQR